MPNAIGLSDSRQPRFNAGVNWSHPFARDLIVAIHWGWQHRALFNPAMRRRGDITLQYSGQIDNVNPANYGGMSGLRSDSVTATEVFIGNIQDLGENHGAWLFVQHPTDTTLRRSVPVGNQDDGTSTRRAACHAPAGDGNSYFDFGGATPGSTRVVWGGHTKDPKKKEVWVFTATPKDRSIWRDGIKRATGTGTVKMTTGWTNDQIGIFQRFGNTTSDMDLHAIFLVLYWRRGLSDGECRQLSADPWQIFATSDINRSFVPAAAEDTTSVTKIPGSFGQLGGQFGRLGA